MFKLGPDLVLVLDQSPDKQLVVSGQFSGAANQIERIDFADGSFWDVAAIQAHTTAGTANAMTGTAGNDTFTVDDPGDTINEGLNQGTDTVNSCVYYTLGANLENLTLTGYLNTWGTGNGLNNTITGNAGNNQLDGGGGQDTLIGLAGDDTYYAGSGTGTTIVEAANGGIDTVVVAGDYTLGANLENLTIRNDTHSIYPATYAGNALDNVITGTTWVTNDTFDGKAGADTYISPSGGGFYLVDNPGDRIVSGGGAGGGSSLADSTDTVISSVDWVLSDRLENLQLTGLASHGVGNARANLLFGGSRSDVLEGMAGNDVFYGNSGYNSALFLSYDSTGIDTLIGGTGDDTYYIDWSASGHDVVVEAMGEGVDTVVIGGVERTYLTSEFPNVENLTLTSSDRFSNLIGDQSANRLIGNEFSNILDAGDGADYLDDGDPSVYGYLDNDSMLGGAGNDTFWSHRGRDWLDGGTGDDYLKLSADSQSTIVFAFGSGADTVDATGTATVDRRVLLGAGVTPNDIQLSRSGADLRLTIGSGADALTWKNYFIDGVSAQSSGTFGYLEFADGFRVDAATLTARLLSGGSNTPSMSNDVLLGTGGADTMVGLAGDDLLLGGGGTDTYLFNRGDGQDVVVESTLGSDEIVLGAGIATAEVTVQRSGTDILVKLNGSSDQITVRNGMIGGLRFIDGTVWTNATLLDLSRKTFGTTGADVLAGSQLDDEIYGLGGNDTISAGTGADRIDGGSGADSMLAGPGDDTYVVDDAGDSVVELANEGFDRVESSVGLVLASNVEALTLTGAAAINGTGNDLDNQLNGNAANNVLTGGGGSDQLDGGAGSDTLVGGVGDDYYFVDDAGDVVIENAGEGEDWVVASVSYSLATNVESLQLNGAASLNATGNAAGNWIGGNGGANLIDGGAGSDTMAGAAGDDVYVVDAAGDIAYENAGEGVDAVLSSVTYTLGSDVENITMTGTGAINATGNTLDNVLTGNGAANVLTGGAGNDTYFVGTGDTVKESPGAGTDTVVSSVAWTLGTNIENLTLVGAAAIAGTGNTQNNVLSGNVAGNTLDGSSGADTMIGGAGDDTYKVDNALDVITELVSEGLDGVTSSVTYVLAVNVENLTLSGTSAVNGTGNASDNLLTGNTANNTLSGLSGNDTLDGGAGNDTMLGGAGNDTYIVNVATDTVTELANEGADTVQSVVTLTLGNNIENLSLTGSGVTNGTGNTLDNVLTGNGSNNTLTGLAGNDTLDGGLGNDTMVGGAGNDFYIVNAATDVVTELANEGTDTVQSAVTLTLANNVENLILGGATSINGTGNALNNVLTGNAAVNVLTGAAGDDTYDGAGGNDTFTDTSTTSNDTYRWGIGAGLDTLTDSGGTLDHVDLFTGIAKSQLRFAKTGNNLELTVTGQTDKLTIANWYLSTANQIEEFRLSDGSKVLASEVQSLVGAMATFSASSTAAITTGRMFAQPIRHFGDITMPAATM